MTPSVLNRGRPVINVRIAVSAPRFLASIVFFEACCGAKTKTDACGE